MTPKEKAEELYDKFKDFTKIFDDYVGWKEDIVCTKKCALICIDEKIELLKEIQEQSRGIHQALSTPKKLWVDVLNPMMKELEQVKQEINKL